MAERLIARSALGSDVAGALRMHGDPSIVMLRELPMAAMLDLRLDRADAGALSAAQSALSIELPLAPGTTTANADSVALWFGPDQWLIVAPSLPRMPAIVAISAVDISDLRAEFELAGPRAADVLRKGCGIDLHPREFGPGNCALTMLARVRVALRQTDDRPAYRIFVERSVALYLWDWFADAMMEFVERN
jgi:sarcosine oxidase subunit gamma